MEVVEFTVLEVKERPNLLSIHTLETDLKKCKQNSEDDVTLIPCSDYTEI